MKHEKIHQSGNKEISPVIIVGCPRSGTYLLSAYLQGTLNLAIPIESQFIPLFNNVLPLYGDLSNSKNRRKLLLAIYDFLALWTKIGAKGRNYKKEKNISLLVTRPFFNDIIYGASSYKEIIENLFTCYVKIKNRKSWGDKMSFRLPVPISSVSKLLPEAKIIHIVRDGRDVALSWKKIWTGPQNIFELSRLWCSQVSQYRAWGNLNEKRYLEIKYEDLIDNTQKVLSQVNVFIGITEQAIIKADAEYSTALSDGNTHKKLSGTMRSDNKNKWAIEMSQEHQNIFESIAGETLIELGYKTTLSTQELDSKIRYRAIPYRIISIFSPINVIFCIKYILPVILLAYRTFKK